MLQLSRDQRARLFENLSTAYCLCQSTLVSLSAVEMVFLAEIESVGVACCRHCVVAGRDKGPGLHERLFEIVL